jgi:hypothetical protein
LALAVVTDRICVVKKCSDDTQALPSCCSQIDFNLEDIDKLFSINQCYSANQSMSLGSTNLFQPANTEIKKKL